MLSRALVNTDVYPLTHEYGVGRHEAFEREGCIHFPRFLSNFGLALLSAELARLDGIKVRRELAMPGSNGTPRRMSTLGGQDVGQYSTLIPMLYRDADLLAFLSGIAGEAVYEVPDPVENHVCNFLHRFGDCHGAHVDVYALAFNVIIDAPPRDYGGTLEFVPNSTVLADLDGPAVKQLHATAGDAYLLRSDRAAHRVTPLAGPCRRCVINMAYANDATLHIESYSSSVLYATAYSPPKPAERSGEKHVTPSSTSSV
jgi:hypothetical protein